MSRFADIAAPLHSITQRKSSSAGLKNAMKCLMTEAPTRILVFPHFDLKSSHFALETDASAGGLGAILQQDGHVIAYASRVLG